MLHTTLSKGKHTAQRKKERYITAQVKGTGEFCIIEVQVKRTGRHIIGAQKRDRKYCKPGSKTVLLIILYVY